VKLSYRSMLCVMTLALLGGRPTSAQNGSGPPKPSTEKWQRITSKASHFSVEMPGAPTVVPRKNSPDPYWNFIDHHTVPPTPYSVTTLPMPSVTPAAAEDSIRKQIADLTKTLSAKVISQKHLTMAGYPGIEMRFQTPDGAMWRELLYVLKLHQYTLMVSGNAKNINAPNVERFFKSFSVSE
jgi:hypothetical protein